MICKSSFNPTAATTQIDEDASDYGIDDDAGYSTTGTTITYTLCNGPTSAPTPEPTAPPTVPPTPDPSFSPGSPTPKPTYYPTPDIVTEV